MPGMAGKAAERRWRVFVFMAILDLFSVAGNAAMALVAGLVLRPVQSWRIEIPPPCTASNPVFCMQ